MALGTDHITTVSELQAFRDSVVKVGFDTAVNGKKDKHALWRALAALELHDAAGGLDAAPCRTWAFMRANWMEAILLVLAVVLAGLGVRAALGPEQMVVARRNLQPFQVIDTADVKQVRAWADFGVAANAADVVGKFPLGLVPSGEPLRKDRLSRIRYAPATELRGRRILSLAIPKRALPLTVAGTHAALLLSPRDVAARAADPVVIDDVIVLNAAEAGDTASVVIAVLEKDVHTVARLLATSEVFIVQTVTAPASPATPHASPPALRDSAR
jgi:hypothetical protein